ncbi:type VII secretion protein EccCa [Myceligenerans indicum]|uniref:Type VII secretion protein EccCa n=1 Tax=Myceligenerans indicum TaxID=2593663 RepID=A0ABS1LGV7_9MICO|nr:type VII secretion protein EccCa [Myceligenerans indicum]MBL0884837.1 type VII secretion protein EccCa [Myceligenerans indicum]
MTQRLIHRPARTTLVPQPEPPRPLAPPPAVGGGPRTGFPLQSLLPVLGAVSSMTMMLVLRNNPVMVVVALMVLAVALVSGLGMALSQRGNAARQRRDQRERYLDHLEELRGDLYAAEQDDRREAHELDPAPSALLDVVRDPARRWERRRWDPDFLRVRLGLGDVPRPRLSLQVTEQPTEPPDPMLLAEARGLADRHALLRHVPVTIPLDHAGEISVVGPRRDVLGVARAMIAQIATWHAPQDAYCGLVVPPERLDDWQGIDQLPHLVDDERFDGPAPVRRLAPDLPSIVRLLRGDVEQRVRRAGDRRRALDQRRESPGPRAVVFVDDWGQIAAPVPLESGFSLAELDITVVHLLSDRLHEPSEIGARVTVTPPSSPDTDAGGARLTVELFGPSAGPHGPKTVTAVSDAPAPALLRGIAHALAPLRLVASAEDGRGEAATRITTMDELLGIGEATSFDPRTTWTPRGPRDFLRVPIGLDDSGAPILLDLKEAAQHGMGPHGLCVGATGSGKSEVLRTLVTALAVAHPPEDLTFILVDFKGGAAFSPFATIPHTVGILDNLADDPGLIQRARASFAGEIQRRQQVLKAAGSPSVTHYRELRRANPDLEPLPHLMMVIDEFGELLTAEPDFVDLLLMIGRIGRSIGVHLLLSSQRIEAGKLKGLETYLSYRLGLRTFSESESQVVLDTPDAFHLPSVPGHGYLKVDTSVYRKFRAGYVSGPVTEQLPEPDAPDDELYRPLRLGPFNDVRKANDIAAPVSAAGEEERLDRPSTETPLVEVVGRRLARAATAGRPVWLPPLPGRISLGQVLGRAEVPTADELRAGAGRRRQLMIPLGVVDDPAAQRQDVWELDLTRSGGHAAVIGAPQSGRTTLLWSLAAGVAMTHTPTEVAVYGMDLAGGGLARVEAFAHVGGVATRADRSRLARLVEELHGMLAEREQVFARHRIDSLAMLRELHAAGRVPELPVCDVVLLIDGAGLLRSDFEELQDGVGELLQRGGGFGLHVVFAVGRWNDLRSPWQSLIGTRLELRLNDPTESVVARKLVETVRPHQTGRVLTDASLFAQVALPKLGAVEDVADDRPAPPGLGGLGPDPAEEEAARRRAAAVGSGLDELAAASAAAWDGPAAPRIRQLPLEVARAVLPDHLEEPDLVPFGVREDTMGPALLDLSGTEQHLLVFGDSRAGRTTVLRTIAAGLIERHQDSDRLSIIAFDMRGGLAESIPEPYLGAHLANPATAAGITPAIVQELDLRMDELSNAPRGQKPSFARLAVMVDDHDMMAAGGNDPITPLVPYLATARDLNLSIVLARPVAGAAGAMFSQVLQSVQNTGGSALIMSGDPAEGSIVGGIRAAPMPPGRGRWVRRGMRPVLVQVAHSGRLDVPEVGEVL